MTRRMRIFLLVVASLLVGATILYLWLPNWELWHTLRDGYLSFSLSNLGSKLETAFLISLILLAFGLVAGIFRALIPEDRNYLNVYLLTLSRFDGTTSRKRKVVQQGGDMMTLDLIRTRLRLLDVYLGNHFIVWLFKLRTISASKTRRCLNFGPGSKRFLAPIRDRVAEMYARGVTRRAIGTSVNLLICQIVITYDVSDEDSHLYVPKAIVVPRYILDNMEFILANPPIHGDVELLQEIGDFWAKNRQSFLMVRLTE